MYALWYGITGVYPGGMQTFQLDFFVLIRILLLCDSIYSKNTYSVRSVSLYLAENDKKNTVGTRAEHMSSDSKIQSIE